jgi:hypothetical protein
MEILIPAVSLKDRSRRYQVVLSDDGDACECPDFFWRHIHRGDADHRCKHIATARQLLVDGVPAPSRRKAVLND